MKTKFIVYEEKYYNGPVVPVTGVQPYHTAGGALAKMASLREENPLIVYMVTKWTPEIIATASVNYRV